MRYSINSLQSDNMIKHYKDYYWVKGKPLGRNEVEASTASISYKIVPDPYHRRFSIEKYEMGRFKSVVYDSFLLDFRHLHSREQAAWQKVSLEDNELSSSSLLINQDDRAVLIETYHFEKHFCRSCLIQSVHGLPIAMNRMYYKTLGDSFNGIVLYDLENRPVILKTYELDPVSGDFTHLLEVQSNMAELPGPLKKSGN